MSKDPRDRDEIIAGMKAREQGLKMDLNFANAELTSLRKLVQELEGEREATVAYPIDSDGKKDYGRPYCFCCGTKVRDQKYCHNCGRKLLWLGET